MKAPLATFENQEEGVKVHVAAVGERFSVSLQDTESGEFLPSVVIVNTLGEAMARAKAAAGKENGS